MNHARGNAVPETALTVSFTLLILYSIVQLATTAFYQISADGASFVASHDTVASYGSPTTANKSNAQSAAQVAFKRIVASSISVLNPNSSTFETDVSQQVPGISQLGNLTALTIDSRLIEASAGSASASPLSDCAQGGLNIVNSANNSVLSSKTVGLLQGGALVSGFTPTGSTSTYLTLSTTQLTGRLTTINGISTQLGTTVTDLTTISSTVAAIPLLGTTLQSYLSQDLTTPVGDALNGTFSSTTELAALDSELVGQVPALGSVLSTTVAAVNTILTGGTAGTGLLGSNGPLATLNGLENTLSTYDAGAPTSCS